LSFSHFHFNSNFIYFWVVIPALCRCLFPHIFLTPNLRGLLGEYLLMCSRDGRLEEIWRWDCDNMTGVCVASIHIATPSKDRHGFSLARTVTQQGKELLKWCFVLFKDWEAFENHHPSLQQQQNCVLISLPFHPTNLALGWKVSKVAKF